MYHYRVSQKVTTPLSFSRLASSYHWISSSCVGKEPLQKRGFYGLDAFPHPTTKSVTALTQKENYPLALPYISTTGCFRE